MSKKVDHTAQGNPGGAAVLTGAIPVLSVFRYLIDRSGRVKRYVRVSRSGPWRGRARGRPWDVSASSAAGPRPSDVCTRCADVKQSRVAGLVCHGETRRKNKVRFVSVGIRIRVFVNCNHWARISSGYRHWGNDCPQNRSSRNPKGFAVGLTGSASEASLSTDRCGGGMPPLSPPLCMVISPRSTVRGPLGKVVSNPSQICNEDSQIRFMQTDRAESSRPGRTDPPTLQPNCARTPLLKA